MAKGTHVLWLYPFGISMRTMHNYQSFVSIIEWMPFLCAQKTQNTLWATSSGKVKDNEVIFKIQGNLWHFKITFLQGV